MEDEGPANAGEGQAEATFAVARPRRTLASHYEVQPPFVTLGGSFARHAPRRSSRRTGSARTAASGAARVSLGARPFSASSPPLAASSTPSARWLQRGARPSATGGGTAPQQRGRCDGLDCHDDLLTGGAPEAQPLGWARQPAELRPTSRPGSSSHTGRSRRGVPVHYDLGALDPTVVTTILLPIETARQTHSLSSLQVAVAKLFYARSGEPLEPTSISIEFELPNEHLGLHSTESNEELNGMPVLLPAEEGGTDLLLGGRLGERVDALRVTALPVNRRL